MLTISLPVLIKICYNTSTAGVVQWQNATFPKLSREFDSLHPLKIWQILSEARQRRPAPLQAECLAIFWISKYRI